MLVGEIEEVQLRECLLLIVTGKGQENLSMHGVNGVDIGEEDDGDFGEKTNFLHHGKHLFGTHACR